MISPSFDKREFFKALRGKRYAEIMQLAIEEVNEAEERSYKVKGAVSARAQGSVEYAALLKKFLFFMGHGAHPGGINDWDFQLFRPICEALVESGEFKLEVLNFFVSYK
jgi:hypothetical protein